jgi:hypothetical protein
MAVKKYSFYGTLWHYWKQSSEPLYLNASFNLWLSEDHVKSDIDVGELASGWDLRYVEHPKGLMLKGNRKLMFQEAFDPNKEEQVIRLVIPGFPELPSFTRIGTAKLQTQDKIFAQFDVLAGVSAGEILIPGEIRPSQDDPKHY